MSPWGVGHKVMTRGEPEEWRVEERAGTDRPVRRKVHLTVRDIRGLLTKISHQLVRTLAAGPLARNLPQEAQMVDARRFVESMLPFLRMN